MDLSDERQLLFAAMDGDKLVVPKVEFGSKQCDAGRSHKARKLWLDLGLRLSELLSDARRDLARDADLGLGLIVRQKNAILDIVVLAFDLASVIASPGTDVDPFLEEFDEVLIFSRVDWA